MGSLNSFNIKKIKEEYNLDVLVETGTHVGLGVEIALQQTFNEVYSIEMLEKFFNEAQKKHKDDKRVTLYNGKSIDVLPTVLEKLNDNKILFWLDAHLPNYHGHKTDDLNAIFPLEDELRFIKEFRKDLIKDDYFIIDDLRIYEVADFENGNCPKMWRHPVENINFIYTSFKDTHDIIKSYKEEGFIILKPKH